MSSQPHSHTIRACGLPLHVNEWAGPSEDAPKVVAFHGFTGDGLDYGPIAGPSSERYTWYAPDLIGHGKSEAPEEAGFYSTNAMVFQHQSIEKALGLHDYILMGYSMGARFALNYALQKPEHIRALVLISGTPGIEQEGERLLRKQQDELLAEHIESTNIKTFLAEWMEQPIIASQQNIKDSIRKDMQARREQNNPIGLANSLRGFGTGAMGNLWPRLNELTMPVLILSGSNDMKFTIIARKMEMTLMGRTLFNGLPVQRSQILGAGHCCHLEYPNRIKLLMDECAGLLVG